MGPLWDPLRVSALRRDRECEVRKGARFARQMDCPAFRFRKVGHDQSIPYKKYIMNTTETTSECIDRCNKLLRGERSAVETYAIAIEKFGDDPRVEKLKDICQEHRHSVSDLEKNIQDMGGDPDTDSGAWGGLAQAVQKSANLLGTQGALESLASGEKIGLKDYEKAIDSGKLMPECVELVRLQLIPRIESHLSILERLEERVD